ncbi:MAG: carnitine operon protein CaiE [marine bacterium B5-7]|nr:MAG: carnitine operon protein CaiE [marine bacterium B5-7]
MPYYAIDGIRPVVHPDAYVHPTAIIIGDAHIGAGCYVAPLAVMRGDFGRLVLEPGSNLQDTCVMHGFPAQETRVEEMGHIGHGAMLHGCHVGRNAMVGMNAVVMDGAVIGECAIVAASTFIKAGMQVPSRSLVIGSPGKVIRTLDDEEIEWKRKGTLEYQDLARRSILSMVETQPLTEEEPGRRRFSSDLKPLYQAREGEN